MAAQGRGNAISILVFVVALLAIAEAKDYNVGDTNNWDYPAANDPAYYDTWAAKQKFVPGDTLSECRLHLPCFPSFSISLACVSTHQTDKTCYVPLLLGTYSRVCSCQFLL